MLQCGTDGQTNEQLKIELLSQWKLEAEFRNDDNAICTAVSVKSEITNLKTPNSRG